MNMCIKQDGAEFVTASALIETPFEFKLFEVTHREMKMSTVSLASQLPFHGEYDAARSSVQGREVDRCFVQKLG